MENQSHQIPEEPVNTRTKVKKDTFNWWQSLLIILITLVVCLSTGYYISAKYFWKNKDEARMEERLQYYQKLVDEQPNEPKYRVELGFTYFIKGNDNEAIKQYKTAIDLDKNYYNAYLNLAIIYDRQNRTDDALEMATKATELAPRDYKGYLLKGISFRKLKMYEKANKSLEEASNLMPSNTDIIYEVGLVAEDQGKKKEAEQIYKEALTYDPLYKPAQKALERIAESTEKK